MRRTTLLLDESLYRQAKSLSQKQGTTLTQVVNDLLRSSLQVVKKKPSSDVKIPRHRNNGPRPGIDIADRQALYEILDS